MTHVRLEGDPFRDGATSRELRSFLRRAQEDGLRVSLSLASAPARAPREGERSVSLTDGLRQWRVATSLSEQEVELLRQAAQTDVAATAAVVTFARPDQQADAARLAGLAWPSACAVIPARCDLTTEELLANVKAALRWSGTEDPARGVSEQAARPWLSLGPTTRASCVHVADDVFACGSDLVVRCFSEEFAGRGQRLRLVLPHASDAAVADLLELAGGAADQIDVVRGPLTPAHVEDAAVVVQPYRRLTTPESLVFALASGRPVVAARFAATAPLLAADFIVHAVGGSYARGEVAGTAHFAPDAGALRAAWGAALAEGAPSKTGARARAHVVAALTKARPAAPPPPVRALGPTRPVVALEAPLLETSATAERALATAQALVARGEVEVRLVPRAPFRHDLAWLRRRAPELDAALSRHPGEVDLWVSAGWPARTDRPDCRQWALCLDWDYGALPFELAPAVTEEVDWVLATSEHARRAAAAAGRSPETLRLLPLGVDDAMHPEAAPDARVTAFKGDLPAVLFCGGLVWRKGIDVALRALLAARAAGHEFVVVVKEMGAERHFGAGHLGGLLDRFEATPGTPPLLRLGEDLSRPELASVYAACDVLLHPNRGGGSCAPALEARACGLPVLATAMDAVEPPTAGVRRVRAARRPVELGAACADQPWVLEPDARDAADQLQQLLLNLPRERAAARACAPGLRDAFGWGAAAAEIERLAAAASTSHSTCPEWTVALPALPARAVPLSRPRTRPQVVVRS